MESERIGGDEAAFGRAIDWVLGALLGITGILSALGGAALYYGLNRADVAEAIRESEFESEVLTEAEAIDALVALGHWSGIGLGLTGLGVLLLGAAVVVVHGRARSAGRGTPGWILGVAGATVEAVLSFIPLSPILGGAAAGYLQRDADANGIGVGAYAGLFACAPALVVAVFAGIGLLLGVPGSVAVAVGTALAVAVVGVLVYFIGLSALGGYVGSRFRDR